MEIKMSMTKIELMKDYAERLNKANYEYYQLDAPTLSDKEYDALFDKLSALESELGIVLSNSPTQKVGGFVLDGLNKVKHSKPMLSAQKTKDINEVKKFLGNKNYYGSFKLDGCTLIVIYEQGKFKQGITRGGGEVGEDVTEACRFIMNLPMEIPDKNRLELRGECVVSWDSFKEINENLTEPYSHPRNLASGSLRNLDLNIVKQRKLEFVVFECVSDVTGKDSFDRDYYDSKWNVLNYIDTLGFTTVERMVGVFNEINDIVDEMKPEEYKYPCDGLIFEVNSNKVSRESGATSHHENCRIALKWKDETYETVLRDIAWNTTRTGVINPIAIFDEVDLDGALTTKATLHNVSIIEKLELGIGDTITVYRSNMVIPKIDDNLTRSNTYKIIDKCPCCGGEVEIRNENGSKTLHCLNPDCKAKAVSKFTHFVSKDCMNIDGLSESTLEKFIERGWLNDFTDVYKLKDHEKEMKVMSGFGSKSVDKLLQSIENSRTNVKLANFINALGIPMIGKSASKDIAKYCEYDADKFLDCVEDGFNFTNVIDGFGNIMQENFYRYMDGQSDTLTVYYNLLDYMTFENPYATLDTMENTLDGKTFVITGSVHIFKNRKELQDKIESLGGKVSGSVSAKTDYLINNDKESSSSKNKKAKNLGVEIISEEDFMEMNG